MSFYLSHPTHYSLSCIIFYHFYHLFLTRLSDNCIVSEAHPGLSGVRSSTNASSNVSSTTYIAAYHRTSGSYSSSLPQTTRRGKEFVFYIDTTQRLYQIRCRTLGDLKGWLRDLKRATRQSIADEVRQCTNPQYMIESDIGPLSLIFQIVCFLLPLLAIWRPSADLAAGISRYRGCRVEVFMPLLLHCF